MSAVVVFTSFPDPEVADRIVRILVEERLVACGQRGAPMVSTYPWQDRIETSPEVPVLLKTVASRVEPLEARLRELHPYDVCEFVWCAASSSPAYQAWMEGWVESDPA